MAPIDRETMIGSGGRSVIEPDGSDRVLARPSHQDGAAERRRVHHGRGVVDPWFALGMGIVVVTGAPGSGKSTLARPLADQLGWSLIEKDVIKESLGDALGEADGDDQRRLSAASFLVIESLVPRLRDTVLEGNVYPGSALAVRLRTLPGAVEVFCRCPLERCQERFVARTDRHAVHTGGSPPLDFLERFAEPVGLDHVVEVATDRAVDVADVVRRVRAALDE